MDNIKHFEQLWEEGEKVYSKDPLPLSTLLDHLSIMAKTMQNLPEGEARRAVYSKIVFLCCCISHELGVNAYAELQSAVEDAKEKLLDP